MADDTLCACGRPLHYFSPETQAAVERLIAAAGGDPLITITIPTGPGQSASFRVQRHYIALHGVKAADLLKGNVPGAEKVS